MAASASDIVRQALEREDLSYCAYADAASNARPDYSLLQAMAEVLEMNAQDDLTAISNFLISSPFGWTALDSWQNFVSCVNAFSALRAQRRGADTDSARSSNNSNISLINAAAKWQRHLFRARKKLQVITASEKPDDLSAFSPQLRDAYASELRFYRQPSSGSFRFSEGTATPCENSVRSERSVPRRDLTERSLREHGMENGSPVKEEGSVGAKSSVVKFATDVDPMQTPKNSTTSEHLYYSPGTPGMMTRQSTGTLSAGEKRQSFSLLKRSSSSTSFSHAYANRLSQKDLRAVDRDDDDEEEDEEANAAANAAFEPSSTTPRGSADEPVTPDGGADGAADGEPSTNRSLSKQYRTNRSLDPRPSHESDEGSESALAVADSARSGSSSGMIKAVEMGDEDDSAAPLLTDCCGIFSCHGIDEAHDKVNQDCACVAYPLKGDASAGLFVVLDGHGEKGDVVSNELLQQIFERITVCNWSVSDEQITRQLEDAYTGAHEHMRTFALDEKGEAPANCSGACGVSIILRRGRAIMAHAGDCRAVLVTVTDGMTVGTDLTHDHKLELPAERERIEATGAYIRPGFDEPYFMPSRVYKSELNPRQGPGLTMSRSLADIDADECGVVPTPEVSFHTIDRQHDKCVILASDGLWEFISSQDAAEVVSGFMARGEPAVRATRFLIAKAALAWRMEEGDYRDDITAVVLYLNELPADLTNEVLPAVVEAPPASEKAGY